MNWHHLSSTDQIEELKRISKTKPVLIFKHSTRCAISSMALNKLERKWQENIIEPYFLDLIRYREISNRVEREFGIPHESPQAILLKDERPIYNSSHSGIDFGEMDLIVKEMEMV